MYENSYESLGADGPFADKVKQFKVRESQREMAKHIELMIKHKGTLVAESATGTGKTFAYLVPAILSGKKVLIATGTKYLQDQLFKRDIPRVCDVLSVSADISLLKGRANYLCMERLDNAFTSATRYSPAVLEELAAVREWSSRTHDGDIAEVEAVAESSTVWPLVTSTADNCLGSKCRFYEDCYVNKARKSAQNADITVINHHLYFADHALKQDGFGKLLPEVDVLIFDEAHQLPDIASNFLGKSLSMRQLTELFKDSRAAEAVEKSGVRELMPLLNQTEKLARDAMLMLVQEHGRMSWLDLTAKVPRFERQLLGLMKGLSQLSDLLMTASASGEALGRCYDRAQFLTSLLEGFLHSSFTENIRWIEVFPKGFRINETPLNVGGAIHGTLETHQSAKIFTSATLSVDSKFDHFLNQMGLSEVDTASWDSQFDYQKQSMLFLPTGLPSPKHPDYALELVNTMLPLVQAARGRTFMLFTSYRLMQQVHSYMKGQGFTLLMQGEMGKQQLVSKFKESDNAVLLATMSFWEGVDIQGEALSCVMIDKLPFEAPNDPVLKARLQKITDEGRNAFMSYQVPRAVTALRQGAGRLIRSNDDYGVLVLCDPRLTSSAYGKVFLDSLPSMRRTHNHEDVSNFLSQI